MKTEKRVRIRSNKWKLVVAYDGTDYSGWQVQPGRATIQGTLRQAVRSLTGETVTLQGSGRTDAGVHAMAQVVSLRLRATIPEANLMRALNRALPGAIRVISAKKVESKFHARAHAIAKTYEYRIFLRRADEGDEELPCPPEISRFVYDCPVRLNADAMLQAASAVVGTHDFTSFAAVDPDRTARMTGEANAPNNVRTILRSEWRRTEYGLAYSVTGNGFLHHMVRNLVGTFLEIGSGRIEPDAIPRILTAKNRASAGVTAPPEGLWLMDVAYAPETERALSTRNQPA